MKLEEVQPPRPEALALTHALAQLLMRAESISTMLGSPSPTEQNAYNRAIDAFADAVKLVASTPWPPDPRHLQPLPNDVIYPYAGATDLESFWNDDGSTRR